MKRPNEPLTMTHSSSSPIEEAFASLVTLNASWHVEVGRPAGEGWIVGPDLSDACRGPFNVLLERIGARMHCRSDKRTIAASFALRYGWASAMAIAPYLRCDCVPDVSLDNVSLKFRENTFFERTAIHEPRGSMIDGDPRADHPAITLVSDRGALLRTLRQVLTAQATPIVEALWQWSGFSRRGAWGMITSSWAAQFTSLAPDPDDQRTMLPVVEAFFAGDDTAAIMQPKLHAVTHVGMTHLYQRRASCCRWYLLPQGALCASCPLVSQEERLDKNRAWMEKQAERANARLGHT
jgi:hypothetical protein